MLRLRNPKKSDPLAVSRALYESGLVEWAEPNFVQELKKDFIPNDRFSCSSGICSTRARMAGRRTQMLVSRAPGTWREATPTSRSP